AAAARDNYNFQIIEYFGPAHGANNIGGGVDSLHQSRNQNHFAQRPATFQNRKHVVRRGAGAGSYQADARRALGQRFLARFIEQTIGGERGFQSFERFELRALSGEMQAFDDERSLAARRVKLDFAVSDDAVAVVGLEAQT